VTAQLLDLTTARYTGAQTVDVGDDAVVTALVLPDPSTVNGLDVTYLLRLGLADSGGVSLSINDYWLSQKATSSTRPTRSGT